MSAHVVVVFDPEGIEPEGELLTGHKADVAKARGVVTLLVVPELMRRSAFGGWSTRSYGRGWQYDPAKGTRGCPLMLHVSPEFPLVHWVARLVIDPDLGSLRGA